MEMIQQRVFLPLQPRRPLRKPRAQPNHEVLCPSAASPSEWSNVASLATWQAWPRCGTCRSIC